MGVFVGKRVVPRHDGEWSREKSYEPLVLVLDPVTGNSYISRRDVPMGTVLTDTSYWSVCSRFSEQMKLLEQEVAADVEAMHTDVSTTKAAMSRELADTKAAMSEELAGTKNAMSEELANTKHSMSDELNKTEERMGSSLADTQRKVSILVDENREDLTTKVDRAVEQLQTGKSEMNQMGVTLNKRIDSLIANKSVTSSSELLDIRVDAQGETHTTAGAAVRAMDTRLQKEIGKKADMIIDATGEVTSGLVYTCTNGLTHEFKNGYCTGMIPVNQQCQKVYYTGKVFNWIGVAGYDHKGIFVCSILDEMETEQSRDFESHLLDIPDGVVYIRASSYMTAPVIHVQTQIEDVAEIVSNTNMRIRDEELRGTFHEESIAFLASEMLYDIPLQFYYRSNLWSASSPLFDTYAVPLTIIKTCYLKRLEFTVRAVADCVLTVTLEFDGAVIGSTSQNLVKGDNPITFPIELFAEIGEYYVRLTADSQSLCYPNRDSNEDFVRNEYMTNEGTKYLYNNPLIVYKGKVYIGNCKEDETLTLPNVAADAAAVGRAIEKLIEKRISANKLDPDAYRVGWFAFRGSSKVEYHPTNLRYGTTDYIPVSENGLVTKGSGTNGVTSQVVYDKEKRVIRFEDENDQYTYQEGDAYVVFCYFGDSAKNRAVVEGTEYFFEEYTEYLPLVEVKNQLLDEINSVQESLSEAQKVVQSYDAQIKEIAKGEEATSELVSEVSERVEAVEKKLEVPAKGTLALLEMSPIYTVCNDVKVERNYHVSVWLDHIIESASWKDKSVGFGSHRDKFFPLFSPIAQKVINDGKVISEKTVKKSVVSDEFEPATVSVLHRSTLTSASKDKFPKVLVMGDSVTDGYLASVNKSDASLPNHYWSWVRYFFEMDRLEAGNSPDDYNCLMLGVTSINGKRYGSSNAFSINGQRYTNYAIGKGGWSAEDLNLPYFENETNRNPFYDEVSGKFSLKTAVDKFKTLADDGKTRLVVGETAGTEVVNANSFDMCTPTHVVINLNHNSPLAEYQSVIPDVVATIKREYPEMIVVLMSIDETGTYFPADYPEYAPADITIGSLHTKNASIYKFMRENLEDEANGIYVLSGNMIQPNVASYPSLLYQSADSAGAPMKDSYQIFYGKGQFGGPNWHPNNLAHAAWGYQLYAFLKYTMSLDVNEEA